jgi:hypothetical protein
MRADGHSSRARAPRRDHPNGSSALQFDWNSAVLGDEPPTAQATFGIFGGEPRQIYTREIY